MMSASQGPSAVQRKDIFRSCVEEFNGGVLLTVRVKPHSRSNSIRFLTIAEPIEVSLTEIAQDGRANKQLFELLSKAFCRKKSSIQLISGARSRMKKILIRDMTRQEVLRLTSDV